jgi:hypothetical protein
MGGGAEVYVIDHGDTHKITFACQNEKIVFFFSLSLQ